MPPANQHISRSQFSFETASNWALILTAAVAALVFIPSNSIPFLYTKSFVLAFGAIITLVFFILARLTRGNVIVPPSLMLGALWLPAIAYGLSALFSGVNPSLAFFGASFEPDTFAFILTVTVLATLVALSIRRPEHFAMIFKWATILAAAILAVQVLILIIGQLSPSTVAPYSSAIGSYADLATIAGLVVVSILITMRLTHLKDRTRIALFCIGAVSLFFLAVANAKLPWIMVGLVALGLFVEAVMRRSPGGGDADFEGTSVLAEEVATGNGERMLAAPLITLAIALFFLIGSNLGNALASSLHISVIDVRPSWQSTLTVGKQVYGQTPLFGSGPDTFGSKWLMSRDATVNQTVFWNLDFKSGIGFIPTSFVTTGIVGVIAWLLFLGLLLYLGVRTVVLRGSSDPQVSFVTTLSFVGAVYLFIAAVFSNVGPVPLAFAFLFAGLFASVLRFAPGKTQWGVIFSRSPRTGFVIVFVLTLVLLGSIVGAYGIVERYVAQIELTQAQYALSQGNSTTAANLAARSLTFGQTAGAYQIQAASSARDMSAIANNSSLSVTEAQQKFQQALASGINAAVAGTHLDPNNYQNWLTLGNLYATVVPLNVQGAYDNAKSAYAKAEALNPTNPTIPYAVAQLEIGAKNAKAAETALTQAIQLKQDYTPAIFLLSQLEVATGNIKDALAAAEAAAYFTPSDPNVLFQVGILRAATGNVDGSIAALSQAVSVSGQFANARYFLAALYAKKGNYADATKQLNEIAALSDENKQAVAPLLAGLAANKNPFPANLLSAEPPVAK